jgi:iron(III) transport system ATP-binding protein
VAREGEIGRIEVGAGGDTLTARLASSAEPGAPVQVALRPDNVVLAPVGDGPNQFPGRVVARHYQGTQTVYEVALFGQTIEAVEAGSAIRHAPDSTVRVALPAEVCWGY